MSHATHAATVQARWPGSIPEVPRVPPSEVPGLPSEVPPPAPEVPRTPDETPPQPGETPRPSER